MASAKCIEELVKATKGAMSNKDAGKFVDRLEQITKRSKASGKDVRIESQKFMQKHLKELASERNILRQNLLKEKDILSQVTQGLEGLDSSKKIKKIRKNMNNVKENIEAEKAINLDNSWRDLDTVLTENKLVKDFNKGSIDKEVYMELWELNNGRSGGVTGSDEALMIAKAVRQNGKDLLDIQNRSGIHVKQLQNRGTANFHNLDEIGNTPKQEWVDFTFTKIDKNGSIFRGMTDIEIKNRLGDMHKDIKFGRGEVPEEFPSAFSEFIKGGASGDMVSRATRSRMLQWKSGEAQFEYHQKFGTKTIAQALSRENLSVARNSALVRNLGSDPRSGLKALESKLEKDFGYKPNGLERAESATMFGEADNATDNFTANLGRNLLAAQTSGKMGLGAMSTIIDPAFGAHSIAQRTGKKNVLTRALVTALDQIQTFIGPLELAKRGRGSRAKKIARAMGIDFRYLSLEMQSRMGTDQALVKPGIMSRLAHYTVKYTGMLRKDQISRNLTTFQWGRELGDNSSKGFSKLNKSFQKTLKSSNIDDVDWDVLRLADMDFEGTKIITPEMIAEIDDAVIEKIMKRKFTPGSKSVANYKFELKNKYKTFLKRMVNEAVPTPGLREKAIVTGGGKPISEITGMGARVLLQFKGFPMAVIGSIQRAAEAGAVTSKTGAGVNFAQLIVAGTVLAYVSTSLKNISKNATIDDPRKLDTWMRAMQQGGSFGLWGDLIFNDFSKFGGTFDKFMLGPTLGDVATYAEVLSAMGRGRFQTGKFWRATKNNIPFQNVWWLRGGLNYLVMDEISEASSPGYKKRLEKSIKRRGQIKLFD